MRGCAPLWTVMSMSSAAFFAPAERGLGHALRRPDQRVDRAVRVRAGIDVQQFHAGDAGEGLGDRVDDAAVATFGEIRNALDESCHAEGLSVCAADRHCPPSVRLPRPYGQGAWAGTGAWERPEARGRGDGERACRDEAAGGIWPAGPRRSRAKAGHPRVSSIPCPTVPSPAPSVAGPVAPPLAARRRGSAGRRAGRHRRVRARAAHDDLSHRCLLLLRAELSVARGAPAARAACSRPT